VRRAAALAALALVLSSCSSSSARRPAPLVLRGPPGVIRVGLEHLRWPLDPALVDGRDETTMARALFATPLRVGADGRLRGGLCSSWKEQRGGRRWIFRCRFARAVADELRRVRRLGGGARIRSGGGLVHVDFRTARPDFAWALTSVGAAPPRVPGPFVVVSASRGRLVARARAGTTRLVFRRVEPHAAAVAFRRGSLDEAPVPLGDLRAALADPRVHPFVRVRRLLGLDVVTFDARRGVLARRPGLRSVYDRTADRADYDALVPEYAAPPAGSVDPAAFRRARSLVHSLPRVRVPIAAPRDPDLAYGARLLVAAWRDIGLYPVVVRRAPDRFRRVIAAYPRTEALRAALAGADVVRIAWVADARFVSPRLQGWREDALGVVDYSRVRAPAGRPRP
jgi:hypothetical protein